MAALEIKLWGRPYFQNYLSSQKKIDMLLKVWK